MSLDKGEYYLYQTIDNQIVLFIRIIWEINKIYNWQIT